MVTESSSQSLNKNLQVNRFVVNTVTPSSLSSSVIQKQHQSLISRKLHNDENIMKATVSQPSTLSSLELCFDYPL